MPPLTSSASAAADLRDLLAQTNPEDFVSLRTEQIGRELAALSRAVPKRRLVLFFGRPSFSDNTKYLFLEALQHTREFDALWMTTTDALADELTQHGLPCMNFASQPRESVRLMLQASVAVFCENMNSALGGNNLLAGALAGAHKIQLWHGVSVKHLDLMLVPHLDALDQGFRNAVKLATRTEYFLSTSRRLDAVWAQAFGCAKVVRAGQPRNAVLVRPPTAFEMIGATLPPALNAVMLDPSIKRILVAPTWQRGKVLFNSSPAFYERLVRWAEREQVVVVVKEHPFRLRKSMPADVPGRLYFLDEGVDVYPWLTRFDAMITDYSSIMFDFLLTGKPIFTFDTRTEVAYGFEPDWSLVPDIPFRYSFDATSFERVLDANFAAHPLRDSQRRMCAELFETDPATASEDLMRLVSECNAAATHIDIDVMLPVDLA